jgi:hypothetical protein
MDPIIPIHIERLLRTDEARILTVARQPSFKAIPAIAAQLTAYSYAEDLHDIHETYENHFLSNANNDHRALAHRILHEKAHQLKLLALQNLQELTRP